MRRFFAALCGVLFTASFAPFNLWFCALALVPLFALVARSETPSRGFGVGFWFGLSFFAVHLFWLPNSLSNYFGPAAWLLYLVAPIVAAFWGLVALVARLLGGRGDGTLALLPALWLLMEWARTQGVFAFPWGSVGYLWTGTPVAQTADLGGVYGLSLLTLVMAALLAAPFVNEADRAYGSSPAIRPVYTPLIVTLLLGFSAWGYGLYRLGQGVTPPDQQALLVQGNTDPLGRALGTSPDIEVYIDLTQNAVSTAVLRPELVIWPEGAILRESLEGMEGEANRLRVAASAEGSDIVTGASVWVSDAGGFRGYNAVYSLSDANVVDRYDKVYLVPFGEGIPFVRQLEGIYTTIYGWFGLGAFSRVPGEAGIVPLQLPDHLAAAYICYESVFPQVSRQMVLRGADLLVNISNDAWFGRGAGAEQHFQMGLMRAVETRRYLLRAGNDGVTAVADPLGRVQARLPRFTANSLTANFTYLSGQTPYVRFGDWAVWLAGLYAFFAGVVVFSRRA